MAHSKQALKRARQSERLHAKNKSMRSDMRSQLKVLRAAVASKDEKAIATTARVTQSKLDKAAARRIIHPNAASRLKARLARMTGKGGK